MDDVAGLVLLSPNFAINDRWAFLLDMPFARDLLPRLGGETRSFEPVNEGQAEHWTTSYPMAALAPMAALCGPCTMPTCRKRCRFRCW